ncbi:hypothetical protein Godav_024534 [Gossypium davidsonii]|uniref:Uncharacterized protein n=1 Tax=Gossypium davidsonii TaxID=34287 RepID=A0A7J8TA32_GOSDV|nr:hypothetical protein [Gossypium davidsonii]
MRLDNYSLLHIREGRFGAYDRRIHGFTSVFEDSSRQNLLENGKCTNLLEEVDEYNGMNEQWVTARIKQKGDSRCIPWKNLKDSF